MTVLGLLDEKSEVGCTTPEGNFPYNPPETYSQWSIAGTHRRIQWQQRIDDDDDTHGHFWAMQAKLQGQPAGQQWYAGLQRNSPLVTSPGKLALFSVWGATAAVAGTATGAVAGPFTEGTSGFRVYAPFTWTLLATYSLRVQADTALGADWWRFDVITDSSGAITYIGSVQVPTAWGDIDGAATVAFIQWFTGGGAGGGANVPVAQGLLLGLHRYPGTSSGLTSCLDIPRATGFFGTPGFSATLGTAPGGGGGVPSAAVAQGLLLGLHRPSAEGTSGSGLYHDSYGQY